DSSSLWLACDDAGTIVAFDAGSGKKLEEIRLEQTPTRRLGSFRNVIHRSEPTTIEPVKLLVSDSSAANALATVVPPTALNSIGVDAVLSPDRARVAYIEAVPIIRDVNFDRVVKCTELNDPKGLAWSPDGRLIAVAGAGGPGDNGYYGWAGWLHIFN